jgi:hypothetical protein
VSERENVNGGEEVEGHSDLRVALTPISVFSREKEGAQHGPSALLTMAVDAAMAVSASRRQRLLITSGLILGAWRAPRRS